MPRRTLILLRHAKSDWTERVPDRERPLSARGRRDAPMAGRWLADEGLVPAVVAASPAVRTQQTYALARDHMPEAPDPDRAPEIYDWGAEGILHVVRAFDDAVTVGMTVGHNPGTRSVAIALAGPGSDPEALARVEGKYPTAGIAVLQFRGSWSALTRDGTSLTHFHVPRG